MPKIKRTYTTIFSILLVLALFFTRFVNLTWGLPEPFHPDERNIAVAMQQLDCRDIKDIKNCLNPHFFAYGQPTIYAGNVIAKFFQFLNVDLRSPVSFVESVIALRFISAFFSLVLFFILWKFLKEIFSGRETHELLITLLLFVFSPALIQFAHFGTTESVLMLLYATLVYTSIRFLNGKISTRTFVYLSSFLAGLAISIKISSGIFFFIPLFVLIREKKQNIKNALFSLIKLGSFAILIATIFSPHSIISWQDFLSALRYEASVAQGLDVFYTRSFFKTIPVVYQFTHIFPYALGLPALGLFTLGFLLLPFNKTFNFLRMSFLIYFLPTAFLYAKWTRFMAPVLPIMLIFSASFLLNFLTLKKFKPIFFAAILISIIPGVALLSIYANEDTRVKASKWMYGNIPSGSFILTETANVVDIPIPQDKKEIYILKSFDFYHLDQDKALREDLQEDIERADYISIPSRRVIKNHTCLEEIQNSEFRIQNGKRCRELERKYPILNEYYRKLLSGELGFKKVAEFSSYSEISFFGKTLLKFPDEDAEETWTVFDHPVVRIYEKVPR